MYPNNDYRYYSESELYHHGIIGQKWGIRRYQNEDGSLTDEGRLRYNGTKGQERLAKDIKRELNRIDKNTANDRRRLNDAQNQFLKDYKKARSVKTDEEHDRLERKADLRFEKNGKKHHDAIKVAKKETDQLIKLASDMGLTVSSKETTRLAMDGKDMIEAAVLSAITLPTVGVYWIPVGSAVSGTKYDVSVNNSKK